MPEYKIGILTHAARDIEKIVTDYPKLFFR